MLRLWKRPRVEVDEGGGEATGEEGSVGEGAMNSMSCCSEGAVDAVGASSVSSAESED